MRARAPDARLASLLSLPQHPYEHRPERPVLVTVDHQLGDVRAAAMSPVRRMTSRNARRIVRGVSKDRGTSPEYPDLRHASTAGPAGPPREHSEHDLARIADERTREDEALQRHKKQSMWKRFLSRRRHVTP